MELHKREKGGGRGFRERESRERAGLERERDRE